MKATKLTGLQIGIIVLTILTAIVHLLLGRPIFILNGLGYLGLLGLLFLPLSFLRPYRKIAPWVLMGYAALTIILYFVVQGNRAFGNILGLVTKLDEVILLVLLWLERRRASSPPSPTS